MANIPPKKQIPQTPVDASGTAQAEAQRSTPSLTTPPAPEAPLGPSEAQPEASTESPLRMGTSADGAGNTAPVAGVAPLDPKKDRWGEGVVKLSYPKSYTKEEVAEMVKAAAGTPQKDLTDLEEALKLVAKACALFEVKPTVRFEQAKRRVQFPPVEMADGGISLRLNDAQFGELRIPENTSVEVSFGYKVSIPAGWVGEVTVAGLVGQRVLCGILVGDGVAELKVRLQTNNPYLPVFRAGEEIAQLHLRPVQPCTVQISNPFDA